MIVVIQCAARKSPAAGTMMLGGGRVVFVADPSSAPVDPSCAYARPDDAAGDGASWREHLLRYNSEPGNNPLGLLSAGELYAHPCYGRLVGRFGADKLFILSAGWGLIPATFLTPDYDITFSASAEDFKRRRKGDRYADFRMLSSEVDEPIVFFGGKDYLPLFVRLTDGVKGPRTIFYSSQAKPVADRCRLVRYETTTRTNWHYECVNAFLDGAVSLP